MGFLAIFTSLFSALPGAIGQYFTTKTAQINATAQLALQVETDKFALSKEIAQASVDSQANELAATTSFTKAIILICVNIPVLITCVHASWGLAIFNALQMVPQWYAMLDVAIIGVVFGLPIASNWMGVVFTNIQQVWADNHQRKLEVIAANGQAQSLNLDQAKKQIFDIMHTTMGSITQAQVNVADPLIKSFISNLATVATNNNNNATSSGQTVVRETS